MTDPTREAFAVDEDTINLALDAWFDGDCSRPHYDEHIDQMRAAASVIVAALSARAQGEAGLWCLHVQGPDDMHPAPSKAHAELGAHLLNEWVSSRDVKDEGYPGIEGVVAIWPHSPEAHAAEAGEFAERFIYPSSLTCGKVAQQGREAGEAVAWIHKDGRALLLDESMHRATNPADWNPLYTTPTVRAVDLDDAMVARAVDAYAVASGVEPVESDIRAALTAALTQPEAE